MSDKDEYELMHFGIKGMKWGVRKKSDDGSKAPSRKERKAEARKKEFDNNVEVSKRRAKVTAELAKEFDLDVFARERGKGRIDYMVQGKYGQAYDSATIERFNKTFDTKMAALNEGLRKDGLKG